MKNRTYCSHDDPSWCDENCHKESLWVKNIEIKRMKTAEEILEKVRAKLMICSSPGNRSHYKKVIEELKEIEEFILGGGEK